MKAATVLRQYEKRFFSVAEANQRLPLVRVIVGDIVTLFADVQERRERLATLVERDATGATRQASPYTEELVQMDAEIRSDIERLNGFAHELAELGVELKDPNIGLCDFPTLVDDREACLCWKLGEPAVDFWHDLKSGFSGRQSVADLTPPSRLATSKASKSSQN